MRSLLSLLPLLALQASAQQILQYGSGQLPTCAQGCTPLIQAQAACVPVPATEKSCFCQSAYLTQQTGDLFTDANAVCSQVCPDQTDRNQIQSWYKNYCAGLNPADTQSSASSAAPTSTTASTATAAATSSSASSSASGNTTLADDNEQPQTWWQAHGKWIAMVIVLVVAFAIIIVVGVWLKKRHDRRVNRATDVPLPVGWGPPSNPHSYAQGSEKQPRSGAAARPKASREHSSSLAEKGKANQNRRLTKLIGR